MNTQSRPVVSDTDLMQTFVDAHDDAPRRNEGPPPKVVRMEERRERVDENPNVEASDEGDFDVDTLERLGLIPKDQPGPRGEREDGAEAQDIDLEPFARHLGVDASDLSFRDGEVMVRTKVDGEVATVPLSKLREGYQLKSHFTRQQEQFLQERQQWEYARQQAEYQFQQQAQMAAAVLDGEEQALNEQYTRDWTRIRQEDPAEYAAQIAEYNQKLQQVRKRRSDLFQGLQQRQQAQVQQVTAQHQQFLMHEAQQLAAAMRWETPQQFQEEGRKLRGYLVEKIGIDPGYVDQIVDHRAFLVVDKARRYDELMAKIATSRKQVAETHPMPSGSPASQPRGRGSQLAQAKKAHANSHSLESAANVFEKLGVV